MKRFVWIVLFLAVPVQAQVTTVTRVDSSRGNSPSYTQGILLPEIEVWGFGIPSSPIVEFGRLWPVWKQGSASLYAGAYASYWTTQMQFFAEPWLHGEYTHGKLGLTADLASYLPFNGGVTALYTDEIFAGYAASKRLKAGLAGAFWVETGFTSWGAGPAVKYDVGKLDNIAVRYLFGSNGSPGSWRMQWTHGFQ